MKTQVQQQDRTQVLRKENKDKTNTEITKTKLTLTKKGIR